MLDVDLRKGVKVLVGVFGGAAKESLQLKDLRRVLELKDWEGGGRDVRGWTGGGESRIARPPYLPLWRTRTVCKASPEILAYILNSLPHLLPAFWGKRLDSLSHPASRSPK